MADWIDRLEASRRAGEAAVLVTVAATRGSAPREAGTHMVVGADWVHGTIGGGHLEYKAIGIARDQLAGAPVERLRRFPLGASLGQCCGGVVTLLFEAVPADADWFLALRDAARSGVAAVLVTAAHGEAGGGKLLVTAEACHGSLGGAALDAFAARHAGERLAAGGAAALVDAGGELHGRPAVLFFDPLPAADFHVVLFGAGHVGRALVRVLAPLADRITWVDPRSAEFPARLPANVDAVVADFPEDEVGAAPAAAWYLVMTHSHELDQRLTEAILRRGDARWFGLIGSRTKRRAFEQRLRARGLGDDEFSRMSCPIGVAGIRDKHPAAIAVAVVAQLLQQREALAAADCGGRAAAAA